MLTVLLGIIALIVGILWLLPYQWSLSFGQAYDDVLIVAKGFIDLALIFGGLIAVAAGISSVKDKIATKKEEAGRKQEEEKKEEK